MAFKSLSKKLVLGMALMSMSLNALAQTPVGNSLSWDNVRSVLYSQSHRKAIVSTVEENGLGRFMECEVPTTANASAVTLEMFSNCQDLPGTSYIADEAMVNSINRNFPKYLERNFLEAQAKQHQATSADASTFAMFISSAGMTGLLAVGTNKTWNNAQTSKGFMKGMRIGGAGVLAAGTLLTGAVTTWVTYRSLRSRPLVSMEDKLKESYADFLKKSKVDVSIHNVDSTRQLNVWTEFYYGVFRQSVIDSVRSGSNL